MKLDGFGGDLQTFGDFLRRQIVGEEFCDLPLAWGKSAVAIVTTSPSVLDTPATLSNSL